MIPKSRRVYHLFDNSYADYCVPTDYATGSFIGDCFLTDEYGNTVEGYNIPVPIHHTSIGDEVDNDLFLDCYK